MTSEHSQLRTHADFQTAPSAAGEQPQVDAGPVALDLAQKMGDGEITPANATHVLRMASQIAVAGARGLGDEFPRQPNQASRHY